jgi:hypothetical protein
LNDSLIVDIAAQHAAIRQTLSTLAAARSAEIDKLMRPEVAAQMGEQAHAQRLDELDNDDRLEKIAATLEEGMRGLLALVAFSTALDAP